MKIIRFFVPLLLIVFCVQANSLAGEVYLVSATQQGMTNPPCCVYRVSLKDKNYKKIATFDAPQGIRMVQVLPNRQAVAIWGYSEEKTGRFYLYHCGNERAIAQFTSYSPLFGGALGDANGLTFTYTPQPKQEKSDPVAPQVTWLGVSSQAQLDSLEKVSIVSNLRLYGTNSFRGGGFTINVRFDLKNRTILTQEPSPHTLSVPLSEEIVEKLSEVDTRANKLWCLSEKLAIFRLIGKGKDEGKCFILVYNFRSKKWSDFVENAPFSYVQCFGGRIFVQLIDAGDTPNAIKPFEGVYKIYSEQGKLLSTWTASPNTEILYESNNDLYFREGERIFKASIKNDEVTDKMLIVEDEAFSTVHWLLLPDK